MVYPSYSVALLGFFAIVAYIFIVDRNVADYAMLTISRIQLTLGRLIFMAKLYPQLRYETFMLKRGLHKVSKKHLTMAESILKDIKADEIP